MSRAFGLIVVTGIAKENVAMQNGALTISVVGNNKLRYEALRSVHAASLSDDGSSCAGFSDAEMLGSPHALTVGVIGTERVEHHAAAPGADRPDDGIVSALKRTLGPIVAGQMVDLAVTPQTLALVLATLGTKTGSETAEKDDEDFVSDQLSPRSVRWAFFETPTRYRIEAVARNDPTQRLVFILALQGASWKLVDVYYRSPT